MDCDGDDKILTIQGSFILMIGIYHVFSGLILTLAYLSVSDSG